MRRILPFLLALALPGACASPSADGVKTTFQTSQGWRPTLDNRADAVMVYGVGGNPGSPDGGSLEDRLASWRARGYETHFMTGIAWGAYQDYFTGRWDGQRHLDEGQVNAAGDTLWHGRMVPYIVPTENYLKYFKERHIKRVIDAGVDNIFLEEPEFWQAAGYSDAFKREWTAYYGTPWRPREESPEAAYLTAKLKYHLYYRALDEAFTFAKEYGRSLGREIRCYVPTHSLINYTQWQIVSPEASLASLPCVDGYIAQVWTGTSRVLNCYRGVSRERVFETAFLEYGCMVSMTAPTGRRVWLLTDPIEDRPRDWEDFRRNYQATFTAQLLYPQVNSYEIMPWPERIYEKLYPVSPGSEEKSRIPASYASMMQVMIGALQEMPQAPERPSRISVLMANSLMFQRDTSLSGFFGLAMPFLKRGCPVGITHLENLGFDKALAGVEVLLMTYSNMKPLDPSAHAFLADWVRAGGHLVYCGTDTDPYQTVREWWNTGGNAFPAPSDHLFGLLGLADDALAGAEGGSGDLAGDKASAGAGSSAGLASGVYPAGRGSLTVLRQDPSAFVLSAGAEKPLLEAVEACIGPLAESNALVLDRGPYRVVAVMDESPVTEPFVAEGCLIDLYDPALPVYTRREVPVGTQALFYDVAKAGKAPRILAAASRAYDQKRTRRGFSYVCKGPADTYNVTRILLPSAPTSLTIAEAPVAVTGESGAVSEAPVAIAEESSAVAEVPVAVVGASGAVSEESVAVAEAIAGASAIIGPVASWDPVSHTLFLRFLNSPDGVPVTIGW